jgi:hypothetical protein
MHSAAELETMLNALSHRDAAAMGYRKADTNPGDATMSDCQRNFGLLAKSSDSEDALSVYIWLGNLWNRADAIAAVLGRDAEFAWEVRPVVAELRNSAWDLKTAIESGDKQRIDDARSVLLTGLFADGSEP